MNVVREIERINARELELGIFAGGPKKGTWHDEYRDSAWVFVGGLPPELSEGDIICVLSQWGEVEDVNLVRDPETNKSKCFAFLKYEDQRSTILAVDNMNGVQVLGRTLRCDHVSQYRLPKDVREREEERLASDPSTDVLLGPGHAYEKAEAEGLVEGEFSLQRGQDVWGVPASGSQGRDLQGPRWASRFERVRKGRKEKKEKKEKKAKKVKKEKKEKKKKDERKKKEKRVKRDGSEKRKRTRERYDTSDSGD